MIIWFGIGFMTCLFIEALAFYMMADSNLKDLIEEEEEEYED